MSDTSDIAVFRDRVEELCLAIMTSALIDKDWEFFFGKESTLAIWCGLLGVDVANVRRYARKCMEEEIERRGGDYLTVNDVVRIVGISESTVRDRIRRAGIKPVGFSGRAALYPRIEVLKLFFEAISEED